jgi:hypothetical protein
VIDPLIAALKVKTEYREALITYVRLERPRFDTQSRTDYCSIAAVFTADAIYACWLFFRCAALLCLHTGISK